jgi:hypothetical protein
MSIGFSVVATLRLAALVLCAGALSGCATQGDTKRLFVKPYDLPEPGQQIWSVRDCTNDSVCSVTVTVKLDPNDHASCLFDVPHVIDLKSSTLQINWTLAWDQSLGNTFAFGWRKPNETQVVVRGIRIRESTLHDGNEDPNDPNDQTPSLTAPFGIFEPGTPTTGTSVGRQSVLSLPNQHRIFFYRIYVDAVDGQGKQLQRCKRHGPMIVNRG